MLVVFVWDPIVLVDSVDVSIVPVDSVKYSAVPLGILAPSASNSALNSTQNFVYFL